ncbi:unnamed protein product [Parnassius mnemosyne]|uniref:Uncharacterized protein n=1 Tax=Parnassius mnemosyne TaxID=213953 RepID=A0AAV1KJS1_9NEOP
MRSKLTQEKRTILSLMKISFFFYKQLFTLHLKISRLLSKCNELVLNLGDLDRQKKAIDILCVTEHNMKPELEEFLTIPNFTLATIFSRNKRRGGSCILVRKGLKYRV